MIIAGLLKEIGYRPRSIVHVGAHHGQEMESYLGLGADHIVWIEAVAEKAELLRQRIGKDERQLVIASLVTDRDGTEFPFHLFNNEGASSSIYRATDKLTAAWPDVRETGEVLHLFSRRLDGLLRGAGMAPGDVDIFVFDVQGAEILAMAGSGAFLGAARYVEVEMSEAEIYEGGPLAAEVESFLKAFGFERLTDIPWHGDVVFRRIAAGAAP